MHITAKAWLVSAATITGALGLAATTAAPAQQAPQYATAANSDSRVSLPLIRGWYDGKPALYISTETSDRQVAEMTHITYSPILRNAIAGGAVDDIYMVTNFKQGNVIPQAPQPEGPRNQAATYTPLWQLNLVTWSSNARPHLLKSEAEIRAEKARGNVRVVKTNVVINCPILHTPQGGLFPGAQIER